MGMVSNYEVSSEFKIQFSSQLTGLILGKWHILFYLHFPHMQN